MLAPPNAHVLMIGELDRFLHIPSLLHRQHVEVVAVRNLGEAEDFLAVRRVDACILEESLLRTSPLETLRWLTDLLGTGVKRLLLGDHHMSLLTQRTELCDALLPRSACESDIVRSIASHLALPVRSGPRIAYRTHVRLRHESGDAMGLSVNVSVGGMLLRCSSDVAEGTRVEVRFVLPGSPTLLCRGRVAHSRSTPGARERLVGIAFHEYENGAAEALREFVRSYEGISDYFGWMKAVPGTPASTTARERARPSTAANAPRSRFHDIFGLSEP